MFKFSSIPSQKLISKDSGCDPKFHHANSIVFLKLKEIHIYTVAGIRFHVLRPSSNCGKSVNTKHNCVTYATYVLC